MSKALYEVLALGMRYWFVFLGLLIVVRTFVWLMKEHRERHRRLRHLPDAGTVGRLLVLDGADILEEGVELTLPYEGIMGSDRTCDVYIPDPELSGEHLDFSFQPQLGVLVYPRRGTTCSVDGEELDWHSKPRLSPLKHGSVLQVGSMRFRVRLFEGLQTGGSARLRDDEPEVATIPNEAFMHTGELSAIHTTAQHSAPLPNVPTRPYPAQQAYPVQEQRPAAAPRSGTYARPSAAVPNMESLRRQPPVRSMPAEPVWVQPRQEMEEPDPFANSDRQRIVSLYEDTEEAGARQVRRRSSWRQDDDA